MESTTPLGPYPVRITDRLEHWAAAAPDRVFLAQRPTPPPGTPADAVAGWRTVTYAEALAQVRGSRRPCSRGSSRATAPS